MIGPSGDLTLAGDHCDDRFYISCVLAPPCAAANPIAS